MALRHIWFLFSLALAAVIASQAPAFMPDLLTDGMGRAFAREYTALFDTEFVVQTAAIVGVGGLILFLFGFLGLAAFDAVVRMLALHALQERATDVVAEMQPRDLEQLLESYPGLGSAGAAYVKTLREYSLPSADAKQPQKGISAGRPAVDFFGPSATAGDRLYRWFFDPLPYALGGIAILLLLVKVVQAFTPGNGGAWMTMLFPGWISLLILAVVTVLVVVLKRGASALYDRQSLKLASTLDTIYPPLADADRLLIIGGYSKNASSSVGKAVSVLSDDIAKSIDGKLKDWLKASEKSNEALREALQAGLEPSLNALVRTSEKSGEDYAQQSRQALDAVLQAFIEGLNSHFSDHMNRLAGTLAETQKVAESTDAAYRQALDAHQDAVSKELAAYAGSFSQTAANFEAMQTAVDNLLTITSPLMRQMINHQEALLKALEEESTASKVIGRAASELSMAAQASRDTVEQFITLAERLREAGKATGGGGGNDKRLVKALRALKTDLTDSDEAH